MSLSYEPRGSRGSFRMAEELCYAVEQFVCRLRNPPVGLERQREAATRALSELCNAVAAAEQTGSAPDQLRRMLAPVRALAGLSPLIRRMQAWPLGYVGDYETVEHIFAARNKAKANSLACLLEDVALNLPIMEQQRNRLRFQAGAFGEVLSSRREPRALFVACGGSAFLQSAAEHIDFPKCSLVLIDIDGAALRLSRHRLHAAKRLECIEGNIFLKMRGILASGPFDFVAAGGVLDSIGDRAATSLIRDLAGGLTPAGRFVFTNMSDRNPYRILMEYIVDWPVVGRSESQVRQLCREAGAPAAGLTVDRDQTGLALLATIKPG